MISQGCCPSSTPCTLNRKFSVLTLTLYSLCHLLPHRLGDQLEGKYLSTNPVKMKVTLRGLNKHAKSGIVMAYSVYIYIQNNYSHALCSLCYLVLCHSKIVSSQPGHGMPLCVEKTVSQSTAVTCSFVTSKLQHQQVLQNVQQM